MRLLVLADNRTLSRDLQTEHGLCVYLETDQHKILLDTGASDIFIQNANKLNVNLQAIDYALQSQYPKTKFLTGHCTGENAFITLSQILTNHLIQFYCGYSENI